MDEVWDDTSEIVPLEAYVIICRSIGKACHISQAPQLNWVTNGHPHQEYCWALIIIWQNFARLERLERECLV